MVKKLVKKLVDDNKAFILNEIVEIKGLMRLLMKVRNINQKWTKEEKKEIKTHLKNISRVVPAAVVFLLPGGTLLLPFLAEVLDRRGSKRI